MSGVAEKSSKKVSNPVIVRNDVSDCNDVIHKICSKKTFEEISTFAREWMMANGGSFHDAAGPTETYKRFLLCIVDRVVNHSPTFTSEQYNKINQFLHTWEEDAFGGLMYVHKGEELYKRYHFILQGIYDNIPEMDANGTIPISNTYIIGAILPSIIRGCIYNPPCTRRHLLHKKLMHPGLNEKKEGGKQSIRKRSKRSKRRTLKRKTRRTHKN